MWVYYEEPSEYISQSSTWDNWLLHRRKYHSHLVMNIWYYSNMWHSGIRLLIRWADVLIMTLCAIDSRDTDCLWWPNVESALSWHLSGHTLLAQHTTAGSDNYYFITCVLCEAIRRYGLKGTEKLFNSYIELACVLPRCMKDPQYLTF